MAPTTTPDISSQSVSQSAAPAAAGRAVLRIPLFGALIVSAGLALFAQPRVIALVRTEELDALWLVAAPVAFAIVVVIAALDAWRVARRRGYFRGPSVVMLAACVAFLGLLLPNTLAEYRARTSPPEDSVAHYEALVQSRDPRVRALVMEAAGFRPGPPQAVASLLLRGLDDADPLVTHAAVRAVEHRAGTPLEGADAAARARAIVQGWIAP